MPTRTPSERTRLLKGPEIGADVLVVRRTDSGHRIVGRQVGGCGRVVPEDAPFELGTTRLIEIYCSDTDLGRARLRHLDAPLREYLGAGARAHPDVDVEDIDDVPLDVDGYI